MKENLIKKITIVFYVLVVLIVIYGIYFFYTDTYSVYLIEKEVTIDVGSSYQMELVAKNSDKFDYKNYRFNAEDTNIINVNDHGEIQTLKEGTTEVFVRYKGSINKQKLIINVVDVEVNELEVVDTFNINVNDTTKISVKINNQDNISSNLIYTSNDETIAKVDAYGNVTGVREGTTTITVKSSNGVSKTVTVTVKANDIEIEEINFDKTELTLKAGEKKTLGVNVVPSNATKKKLEWSSSNPKVATVDSNGKVTALKEGYAVISVKVSEGINSQITVYVTEEQHIILSNYNIEMEVGASSKISANIPVKWSSSNTSIVTVDSKGNLKALKAGRATITATANNRSDTCSVLVSDTKITTKEVRSLDVVDKDITLTENETKTITVIINPTDAKNKTVKFASEDTTVATVDANGKITAKKAGKTKIIITSESNKNVKTEVLVTVKAKVINITSISLNTSSKTLIEGDTFSLGVTYVPQDATNKSVTWSSSDSTVVSVSTAGKVTAKKAGSATITAKTSNNKTASVKITVNKKEVDVTSVKISSTVTSMYVGDSVTLSATVSPSNATNKKVTWSSSDTTVATVDSNGVVTAKKSGSVKITVKSVSNTSIKDSKTITVNVKTVPVTKLTTEVTSKTLKHSKTYQWTVSVEPSNATNKQITYSSSDTTVATVDSKGLITSKSKNGTATITAKSKDNSSKTVTIKITVYEDIPLNVESGLKTENFTQDLVWKDNLYVPKNPVENMPMLVIIPASDYSVSVDVGRLTAGTSIFQKSRVFVYVPNISYAGSEWKASLRKHIDNIVNKYKINKNKIFVSGCSTGGWNMYIFVASNKDLFSAMLSTSTGISKNDSVIKDNVSYFKSLPTKGFGETTSTSTYVNGKYCTGTTSGWTANTVMSDLFNYLGKSSDYKNVKEMCHSDVTDYAFSIDDNKDGKSDILEWLISQTKK